LPAIVVDETLMDPLPSVASLSYVCANGNVNLDCAASDSTDGAAYPHFCSPNDPPSDDETLACPIINSFSPLEYNITG
jgi:hypothetical protein